MLASTLFDTLDTVLPLVLLFGFWIFLTRRIRDVGQGSINAGLEEKMEEIRRELEGIRRVLER